MTSMADLESARRWLAGAERIAVLTGAGISAESGVPVFRGPGGLWRQYRPEELATPGAFARDPRLVWEWYDWRRAGVRRRARGRHRAAAGPPAALRPSTSLRAGLRRPAASGRGLVRRIAAGRRARASDGGGGGRPCRRNQRRADAAHRPRGREFPR